MGSLSQEADESGLLRGVTIYCPQLLTDRIRVIRDIVANGGRVENKLNLAEILLAEDNHGMDWYRPVLRERKSAQAHVVDRGWLYDSISAEIMKDPESYLPSYLGNLSKASTSTKTSTKKTTVKTNERQLRSKYTMADTIQIINVLTVMSDWSNISKIASCLALLDSNHTVQSYISNLQQNMGKGNHYDANARRRREELDETACENLKQILCNKNPQVKSLLDWKASKSYPVRGGLTNELSPPQRFNRRDEVRHNRTEESMTRDQSSEEQVSRPNSSRVDQQKEIDQRGQVQVMQDTLSSTDTGTNARIEIAIGTSASFDEQISRMKSSPKKHSQSAPALRLTEEEKLAFIHQLVSWLGTLFEEVASSQSSILGIAQMSQEFPRPPVEVFTEMASKVPNHSLEEWQAHFEEGSNAQIYLELAHQAHEEKILEERDKALQEQGIRKIGSKGLGTMDESEENSAEEKLEANPDAYLDAESLNVSSSSEELQDEEDELDDSEDEVDDVLLPNRNEQTEAEGSVVVDDEVPDSLDSANFQTNAQDTPNESLEVDDEVEEETLSNNTEESQSASNITKKKPTQLMMPYVEICSRGRSPFFPTKDVSKPKQQRMESRKRRRLMSMESDEEYTPSKSISKSHREISTRSRSRNPSARKIGNQRKSTTSAQRDPEFIPMDWDSPRNRKKISRTQSRDLRSGFLSTQPESIASPYSRSSIRIASISTPVRNEAINEKVAALIAQDHVPSQIVRKSQDQRLQSIADKYNKPLKLVSFFFKQFHGSYDDVERSFLEMSTRS